MKSLVLSLVLVSTSVFAFAADTPSLAGSWKVHTSISGNESDSVCTFTQKDSVLTGSCKSDQGEGPATGKIDGTKITWSYSSEYNGSPITINYVGTLDAAANKIAGAVSVEEFGVDGLFTATPSK
jgi:hypothetical protein